MTELVAKFVAAFKRGIEGEVAAMRDAAEVFEIPLTNGEHLGTQRYSFDAPATADRLAPGTVGSLRTPRGDDGAVIERIERSPGRPAGGALGPEQRSERRSENNA